MWKPINMDALQSWLAAQYTLREARTMQATLLEACWRWLNEAGYHKGSVCVYCQSVWWESLRLSPPNYKGPLEWEVVDIIRDPRYWCGTAGHNVLREVKEPNYEQWRQHILSLGKPAGIP